MRKSVMEHRFSNVPSIQYPRSTFDRSHGYKSTFDSSLLVPILVDEILPGDTVNCNMTYLMRLATPTYPIMDNIFAEFFAFFVPNRLLWDNWIKFMGEQEDPGDSISYTIPVTTLDTDATGDVGSLADYMGIPLIDYNTSNYTCNALPFRAYFKCFNDWFRDENLQATVSHTGASATSFTRPDGPDIDTHIFDNAHGGVNGIQMRGKRHDYFTSALPWLQKGTAVELPLGTEADVLGIGIVTAQSSSSSANIKETGAGGVDTWDSWRGVDSPSSSGHTEIHIEEDPNSSGYPYVRTDLTNATAATVNEVRQAFQVQRLLEKDARAGTRYIEIVKSHFGVTSPDARHQRAEFLGSASNPINVNPVAQTDTSVGDLGAFGTGYGNFHFVKSFTEHGYLIVLANVRADLSYYQGFERLWNRSTRYDFYTPVLAHLGEQSILNREIYIDDATITAGTDDDVFGYQERWAEYRYKPSRITGLFRGDVASNIDEWHLAELFASEPNLNAAFIRDSAISTIDRAIVTSSEPHWLFDSYFDYKHTRVMPVYSVPGLIDHF